MAVFPRLFPFVRPGVIMMRPYPFRLFYLFIAVAICFPGCAAKMSLEEAKKVAVTMDDASFTQPSRRITDILLVLNQPGQFDDRVTRQLSVQASQKPPEKADDQTMAQFFHKRGSAALQQGHIRSALDTCNGNVIRASKQLGIDRSTLMRKMKRYQLTRS